MNINTNERQPGYQTSFLDQKIVKRGQVSPMLGDWAEEFVSQFLNAPRLTTDSRGHCPDIKIHDTHFCEVKAVSSRGSFEMFEINYDAYRKMVNKGITIWFVIVRHSVNSAQVTSVDHFRRNMSVNIKDIIITPAKRVLNEVDRIVSERGWAYAPRRPKRIQRSVRVGNVFFNTLTKRSNLYLRTYPVEVYGHRVEQVRIHSSKTFGLADLADKDHTRIGWHAPDRQKAAQEMLYELQNSRHQVIVVRYDGMRGYRKVVSRNPPWYEALLADHWADSRKSTPFRRRNVLSILDKIVKDKPTKQGMEATLLPYIDRYIDGEWEPLFGNSDHKQEETDQDAMDELERLQDQNPDLNSEQLMEYMQLEEAPF